MELRGSERRPLPGARALGLPRPDELVEVSVLLRRRPDGPPLPDFLARTSPQHPAPRPLSREEFAARHGAGGEDRRRLSAFAERSGLTVVSEIPAARLVKLAGPLASVERAFGVRLQRWTYPAGSYRGREGPVQLPDDLADVVLGVFGLDNRPQARTHFRRRRASSPGSISYSPPTVGSAYDFPAGANGVGQAIGLLELGGGYRDADLAAFFGNVGIPVPRVTSVSVDGETNSPTGDPDGPDGEVELDLEVAGSLASGATLVVYFAPNTDQGFLDGLSAAVHDTTNRPSVVSVSWGGPEESWTAQARAALNSVLEDAAALGVTVTVASGDDGATDGSANGALEVDFPASSPYALACGGTHLALSGTTIAGETVWNDLSAGEGATGGGVSQYFPPPDYQQGVSVPLSPGGAPGRGVPDVAGNADPATGFAVWIDGAAAVIGGTSAVAPLWAALVARLNQGQGAPLGFLNPRLYAPAGASTFHDILSGNNDGYSAGPGWDACTGLGSPDGGRLRVALEAPGP